MPIGAVATLRGEKMYEFLDRLISIALPRVRDFRASRRRASMAAATTRSACATSLSSPRSTMRSGQAEGMNVTIVTTAADDNGARALLKGFGMPFRVGA